MKIDSRYIIIFIIGIFFVIGYSCKKDSYDKTNTIELGYDYYPLEKGKYVIYNVDSISIDAVSAKYDTTHCQLKEVLSDTIFSEDRTVLRYKIERFVRRDSNQIWEIKNVWQILQSKTCLIRIEENIPLVKQVYPMIIGQTWNINQYDTLPEKINTLKSFDIKDTINGKIFEKTAQTVQLDFSSYYQKQYETEKYVRGIGLVYKQLIDVESQSKNGNPVDINKPIMARITMGTIITWTIYSHN